MSPTDADPDEAGLLRSAAAGDSAALGRLLQHHRERLERMVRLRLDQRIQSRVNPSDVIQETCLEAARRLREYVENPDVPFFVWLRFLAQQRLQQVHRFHLGRQVRDARREVQADPAGGADDSSSGSMAVRIAAEISSVSTVLQREELRQRLQTVLDELKPLDREILMLRHFEQLSNVECAQVLNLAPTAAINRYVRALERLRSAIGGDWESV